MQEMKHGQKKSVLSRHFAIVVVMIAIAFGPAEADEPYSPSPMIAEVIWDPISSLVRLAPGSDNWPMTWADDDHQYACWGDGGGFGGTNEDGRVSLGVARIEGSATSFSGYNRWGGKDPEYPATFSGKSYGILSVDGVLYMWVGPGSGWTSSTETRICWSNNHGATWQQEDSWKFVYTEGFSLPAFLTFGKDYQGARDGYVYVYAYDASAGEGGPFTNINLARVPKEQIRNRSAYEFFQGLDGNDDAIWTSDINQLEPVFVDPTGVGTVSVTFNPGIGRYILCTSHGSSWGQWGIFDAPEPWGPWTTVAYYDSWLDNANTFFYNFPTKWISPAGLVMYMVFTGVGEWDSFNLLRATLTLSVPDTTYPSIPQNTTASAVSESQINLAWEASSDPESGIDHYNIYRDNSKIAASFPTLFSDTNLQEGTTYSYEISAVNGVGLESGRSEPASATTFMDTTPPTIVSVSASSAIQVDLQFSEPVEEISAENEANYEIDNGIDVFEANLDADLITVNDVQDRASIPNTIAPNSTANYQLALELEVTNLNKANYLTGELEVGDQYYVDRTYTIVSLSPGYEGLLWIKTANDDKQATSEEFLTFSVNQDVTAYVAYDSRATSLPYWITDHYAETGVGIQVSDVGASPLQLWGRDFPAGTVVMGGNMAVGASGAASMYVVLLRGHGSEDDTVAPLISQLTVTEISDSAATVQWTTDELSDSQVEYGLTPDYGLSTPLDTSMVSQHSVGLVGLLPETLYHYRARSADHAGNVALSEDHVFETGDMTPPQISSIAVLALSDTTAIIGWSTDELADSKVEYGLDPGSYDWSVEDLLLTTSHSLELIGLFPATQYHYRVLSQDAWGNASASAESSFVTKHELPGPPGKPEHYDD